MEQIQSQDKLHIMGIDEYMQMVRREKGIEIGIEKGMEKGLEQERRAFVENLLSATEFSRAKRSRSTCALNLWKSAISRPRIEASA
jgi:hypothetical protein